MSELPVQSSAPAPAPAAKMTVEQLASTIKSKVQTMLVSYKNSVTNAMEVGDLLKDAKKRVGHGNFEAWIKDHCSMSYRSARRYMQMATDRGEIEPQLKMANVASLPAPSPPPSSDSSNGGGSGGNTTPAGQYDKLEEQLIKKLKELNVNEVRDHASKTIGALNDVVDDIESAGANRTKTAKLSGVVRQ